MTTKVQVIELGDRVEDIISGFKGITVAITDWLYGCRRVCIQPEKLEDGKPPDHQILDEAQLKITKKYVLKGDIVSCDVELGDRVRDKTTGYTGIVIGVTQWIHGTPRVSVQSETLEKGVPVEPYTFDFGLLKILEKGKIKSWIIQQKELAEEEAKANLKKSTKEVSLPPAGPRSNSARWRN